MKTRAGSAVGHHKGRAGSSGTRACSHMIPEELLKKAIKVGILKRKSPFFLKTIMESFLATTLDPTMWMPVTFWRAHGHKVAETVTLEGSHGRQWKVGLRTRIRTKGRECCFKIGWREFAFDHDFKVGDQLVFTLVSHSNFTVRVFDKLGKRSPALPPPKEYPWIHTGVRSWLRGIRNHHRDGRASSLPKCKYTVKIESCLKTCPPKPDTVPHNADTMSSPTHVSSRDPVANDARAMVVMEGRAYARQIKNPNFMLIMRDSQVHGKSSLEIPFEFVKESRMPSKKFSVRLIDCTGKAWNPQCAGEHPYRRELASQAWAQFALYQGIEAGDVCVFELTHNTDFTILVRIFPLMEVAENAGWNSHLANKSIKNEV